MDRGGDTMGDFGRLLDASRDRLLERPRTRALMAPKNSEAARDDWDVCEAGDMGGDDVCEFCEPTVSVRMGCIGWKLGWGVMIDKEGVRTLCCSSWMFDVCDGSCDGSFDMGPE
jgi:hypothetical protein